MSLCLTLRLEKYLLHKKAIFRLQRIDRKTSENETGESFPKND